MRACISRAEAALLAGLIAIGIAPALAQTAPKPPPAFLKVLTPPTPAESIEDAAVGKACRQARTGLV
jgi:hypothetical protein